MPAPAVIPAPIAYIKVVVVKKLVVGSQSTFGGLSQCVFTARTRHFTVYFLAVLFTECRQWSVRLL